MTSRSRSDSVTPRPGLPPNARPPDAARRIASNSSVVGSAVRTQLLSVSEALGDADDVLHKAEAAAARAIRPVASSVGTLDGCEGVAFLVVGGDAHDVGVGRPPGQEVPTADGCRHRLSLFALDDDAGHLWCHIADN